jgi:hypothetical protein
MTCEPANYSNRFHGIRWHLLAGRHQHLSANIGQNRFTCSDILFGLLEDWPKVWESFLLRTNDCQGCGPSGTRKCTCFPWLSDFIRPPEVFKHATYKALHLYCPQMRRTEQSRSILYLCNHGCLPTGVYERRTENIYV